RRPALSLLPRAARGCLVSGVSDLRFDPPPECDRPGCCDLSCVWDRVDEQAKAAAAALANTSDVAGRVADALANVLERGEATVTLPDGSTVTVSWNPEVQGS
nr:hypothetical protein [Microthrixaceae bacterium]